MINTDSLEEMSNETIQLLNSFISQFKTLRGTFFSYTFTGLHREKSRQEGMYSKRSRTFLPSDTGTSLRTSARNKALVFSIPVGRGLFFTPTMLSKEYGKWIAWIYAEFDKEKDSLRKMEPEILVNFATLKDEFKVEENKMYNSLEDIIGDMSLTHYERPNPLMGISEVGFLSEFELNYISYVYKTMRDGFHKKYSNSLEYICDMISKQRKTSKGTIRMIVSRIDIMRSCDIFNVYGPLLDSVEFSLKEYLDKKTINTMRLVSQANNYTGRLRSSMRKLKEILDTKNTERRRR